MFKVLEDFEEFDEAKLGAGYAGERNRGVKYTDGSKYELQVSNTLFWAKHYPWRGHMVDGMKVFDYYRAKWKKPGRAKPVRNPGAALQGGTKDQLIHWSKGGLIWVLAPSGKFYSHIPKVTRFHHSSLTGGANVASAGMWLVQEGRLTELAPLSGHYQPTLGQFMNGVLALKAAVKGGGTKLFLYSRSKNEYETLPYDKWTTLTWQEMFDGYLVNPNEKRDQKVAAVDNLSRSDLVYPGTYPGAAAYPGGLYPGTSYPAAGTYFS